MTEHQIVDVDGFKVRAKATWMAGDYGRVAKFTEATAEDFIARRHIRSGARVLDVACGTGNLAIPAARAGAAVAGIDIAPNLLDQAGSRANREEVNVDFQEGDAEALPYQTGAYVWSHVRAASRHRCSRVPPGLRSRRPGRHGQLNADRFHRGTFQGRRQTRCPYCRRAQPVAMGR
jgi:SAM-dependent methyltransferase